MIHTTENQVNFYEQINVFQNCGLLDDNCTVFSIYSNVYYVCPYDVLREYQHLTKALQVEIILHSATFVLELLSHGNVDNGTLSLYFKI